MPKRITVDELFHLLHDATPHFFSVTFDRRTNRRDGSAVQGEERKMLCRCGIHKYKLGVIPDAIRDAEDFRTATITVWSMDSYMAQKRRGVDDDTAAWNSWRRIDLVTVKDCSIWHGDDLPPDILAGLHNITNAYRLANLPRMPV
jgi:hypothetical protein